MSLISKDGRAERYMWDGITMHDQLEITEGTGKVLCNLEDLMATPGAPTLPPEWAEEAEEPKKSTKDSISSVSTLKRVHDLDVVIENPKGSIRRGRANGEDWEVAVPVDYGYIRRHEGADGDQIDCHVGPNPASDKVWVINQNDLTTDAFDEHKVMLGFDDEGTALRNYRDAYHDGLGAERIGGVVEMTMDEFKNWLSYADLSEPCV